MLRKQVSSGPIPSCLQLSNQSLGFASQKCSLEPYQHLSFSPRLVRTHFSQTHRGLNFLIHDLIIGAIYKTKSICGILCLYMFIFCIIAYA